MTRVLLVQAVVVVVVAVLSSTCTHAWSTRPLVAWSATTATTATTTTTSIRKQPTPTITAFPRRLWLFSEEPTNSNDDNSSSENSSKDEERTVTSFDDAGRGLRDEEDKKRMEEAGDFDSNPAYQTDSIDRMREAIRKRTEEMGLQKSVLSKQLIQDANARAQAGEKVQGLDLSKIRGSSIEDLPTILFDPDEQLSDEEKDQVDPMQKESFVTQAQSELTNSKWPDMGSALREVVLMIVVVIITSLMIIEWDQILRSFYTDTLGIIPSKDAIQMRFDGLDLPQGWTNMMSEDDIANLPSAVRESASSSAAAAAAAAASTSGGASLPDL